LKGGTLVSDEAAVQRMFAEACFGARSEADFTRDLRGFLERHGVAAEDVAAIVASPPRLALYRRLVRNNLTGVTERMLERTRARWNALGDGAFDRDFDRFLAEVGPRSHYLRDVPGEFLAWVGPVWRGAGAPPWLADLAAHELAEFQLGAAPARRDAPEVAEVTLDRALVFAEPVRLLRYAFAVHELPRDEDDRAEPRAEPTTLLAYRDAEHTVRFLKLAPFAEALVDALLAGATLGDAVRRAAPAQQRNEATLAEVARLLADFGARGLLLGARA
jgi:hypothetical protein